MTSAGCITADWSFLSPPTPNLLKDKADLFHLCIALWLIWSTGCHCFKRLVSSGASDGGEKKNPHHPSICLHYPLKEQWDILENALIITSMPRVRREDQCPYHACVLYIQLQYLISLAWILETRARKRSPSISKLIVSISKLCCLTQYLISKSHWSQCQAEKFTHSLCYAKLS